MIPGNEQTLPSVQNKKQKWKLFLQFVFSYCEVFTEHGRLTGIWNKCNSSDEQLYKELTITYPHLGLAIIISGNSQKCYL